MEQILKLKEESEAFQTEFEVLAPSTLPADIERSTKPIRRRSPRLRRRLNG